MPRRASLEPIKTKRLTAKWMVNLPVRYSQTGRRERHFFDTKFTYVLAVTVLNGDRKKWEQHPIFRTALQNNPIRILDLTEMLDHIQNLSTTTVAASDIGRVLQLMKAAEKGKKALKATVEAQMDNE